MTIQTNHRTQRRTKPSDPEFSGLVLILSLAVMGVLIALLM